MEINKHELLDLLNRIDEQNQHTDPDHDFPELLRDEIQNYIELLEIACEGEKQPDTTSNCNL